MNLSNPRLRRARGAASATRRPRACPVAVLPLEGRLLLAGDVTAPLTTLQVVPNTLNAAGYYTTSPETVNLVATDADSPNGLMTFYKVDSSAFVAGNSLQLVNGIHTVQFDSVDQSGNQEATQTQTIKIDATAPIVTATANPSSLWPPNNKFVTVTVSGHVADASGAVPGIVGYRVIDEYGQVQPSGTAAVDSNGNDSFPVMLQSSRTGQDHDGRHYTIVVAAMDEAGNMGAATTSVVVPHDQGNHGGVSLGGGGGGPGIGLGNGNQGHGNPNKGVRRPVVVVAPVHLGRGIKVVLPVHGNTGNQGHGNGKSNGNGHGSKHG